MIKNRVKQSFSCFQCTTQGNFFLVRITKKGETPVQNGGLYKSAQPSGQDPLKLSQAVLALQFPHCRVQLPL